jgi:hypothetical protein
MRTSEKPQNANFALTEFSEVRQEFIGNSSALASVGALINLRRDSSVPPLSEGGSAYEMRLRRPMLLVTVTDYR